jgi:hypothetical protein
MAYFKSLCANNHFLCGIDLVERVYLDTNVYCRPFDDQIDKRIRTESEAFILKYVPNENFARAQPKSGLQSLYLQCLMESSMV